MAKRQGPGKRDKGWKYKLYTTLTARKPPNGHYLASSLSQDLKRGLTRKAIVQVSKEVQEVNRSVLRYILISLAPNLNREHSFHDLIDHIQADGICREPASMPTLSRIQADHVETVSSRIWESSFRPSEEK